MYTLLFPVILLLIQAFRPVEEPQVCGTITTPPNPQHGTVMTSSDGGKTWRDLSFGLPKGIMPNHLEAIGDKLLLGAQDGLYTGSASLMMPNWTKDRLAHKDITGIYPGRRGPYVVCLWNGIYQLETQTGMWNPVHQQLQDKDIHTVMEAQNGDLYAGCESGLYRSSNRGKSWDIVLQRGPAYQLMENGNTLTARTSQGLWRSTDGGEQWDRSLQTVHAPFHVGVMGSDLVAISHGDAPFGVATPNMVYRSTDQGVSWSPVTSWVNPSLYSVHDLRQVGETLYACSGEGLFRSDDQGATWIPLLRKPGNKGGFFKMVIHQQTLMALYIEGC